MTGLELSVLEYVCKKKQVQFEANRISMAILNKNLIVLKESKRCI